MDYSQYIWYGSAGMAHNQEGDFMNMSSLTFAFVVVVVLSFFFAIHRFRRRLQNEIGDFEETGREMRAEFENQLTALVPHIYHRPSRVLPSVEQYMDGRWPWNRRNRILLTVRLTDEKDLSTVGPMFREYVEGFLKKEKNSRFRVRICFPGPSVPSEDQKGEGK